MKSIAEVSETGDLAQRTAFDLEMYDRWAPHGDERLMRACTPYLRSGQVTDRAARLLWSHVVKGSEAESLLIDLECRFIAQGNAQRWATVASSAHNGSNLERFALLMHHLYYNERMPETARFRCRAALRALIRFCNPPGFKLKFKRP